MGAERILRGRYELREIIGRGGMGVVYRAFDPFMKREVAVKTLYDVSSPAVLELFYRECDVLRSIVHPNIIDILDIGEYEDAGSSKPFFVMPLLQGRTLGDVIHPAGEEARPLDVERTLDIACQTSRGLHAAHERDLLHRDVKPSNIFVLEDYSVKLIDFGVAHVLKGHSMTGIKGTLEYMAPEQLGMKPLTRQTDIFSLGTACYETLTGQQPFRRATDREIAHAVLNLNPALVSDVNAAVPKAVARVIARAMAKEPALRFPTAAEFAEALQRAARNEGPGIPEVEEEAARRVDRARRGFEENDYHFASEILCELEAEGHNEPAVIELRGKLEEALRRERVQVSWEKGERYFREGEYSLALRRLQEVLELDPAHAGAIELRKKLEAIQTERRLVDKLQIASALIQRRAFSEARMIVDEALDTHPDDLRVRNIAGDLDAWQQQLQRQQQEQARLYDDGLRSPESRPPSDPVVEALETRTQVRVSAPAEPAAPETALLKPKRALRRFAATVVFATVLAVVAGAWLMWPRRPSSPASTKRAVLVRPRESPAPSQAGTPAPVARLVPTARSTEAAVPHAAAPPRPKMTEARMTKVAAASSRPLTSSALSPRFPIGPPAERIPAVNCHSDEYRGLEHGTLFWKGVEALAPGGFLVLGRSELLGGPAGKVAGNALPGCGVTLQALTPGISIEESPSPGNRFSRVRLSNTSDHAISSVRLAWSLQ